MPCLLSTVKVARVLASSPGRKSSATVSSLDRALKAMRPLGSSLANTLTVATKFVAEREARLSSEAPPDITGKIMLR